MTITDLENKYPKRNLPDGAEVVRVSPSPTGFVHLGLLYMAIICQRVAESTKGIFILRIEDTDTAREVKGAKESIVNMLAKFNIKYDEGLKSDTQVGNYGPYVQSERKEIYDVCIDYLLSVGRAYRCFMTLEELDTLRAWQTENKIRPGVYGEYAKYRDKEGSGPYVIRFLSRGNEHTKFKFYDEIIGDMEVPENDEDFVLRKGDGLPTYHLAHVVDDHLMRTTFVLRGNEWWASLGKHIEIWQAFGWDIPKYGHLMSINKTDDGGVRKLSKRKDPEADVQHFLNQGYMPEAIIAYLLRLINPSFDDWMKDKIKNDEKINTSNFPFNIKELSRGGRGPLLDIPKLDNISSEFFSYLYPEELYELILIWSEKHDIEFKNILEKNKEYAINIFSIERKTKKNNKEKIRKDINKLADMRQQYYYFFDELYEKEKMNRQLDQNYPFSTSIARELKEKIKDMDMSSIDLWLAQMKEFAVYLGYDKFANFMRDFRLALTLEEKTPNLYDVILVMGMERVMSRL